MKLKKGDIVTRVKGNLSVVCSKDKRDVCSDEYAISSSGWKLPRWIWPCRQTPCNWILHIHMGFVDKSDRMVNSYGIAQRIWKRTKKLFFPFLDMTILNAYLLHKLCGGKMPHKKFREILVQNLMIQTHVANITVSGVSRGRPSSSGAQMGRPEVKHSQHWPSKGKQRPCRVCSLNKKSRSTLFCCKKCDVGLCVVDCYKKWHTPLRVWALNGVNVNCEVMQFTLSYSLSKSLLNTV
jgi:hypothetical protein